MEIFYCIQYELFALLNTSKDEPVESRMVSHEGVFSRLCLCHSAGCITFDRALLDLEANVNLLPTSVYKKFEIEELKSTSIILQLVDRSVKIPYSLIQDVLVRVNQYYFSVDFLVLDMEPS